MEMVRGSVRRSPLVQLLCVVGFLCGMATACATYAKDPAAGTSGSPSTEISLTPTNAPTTLLPGQVVLVMSLLEQIDVQGEHRGGYDRKLWPHWLETNGCSTREHVLIDESTTPAQVDAFGCKVVAGDWMSAYDNLAVSDPSELDVDHVVALQEAHDSGGWAWSEARRAAYANDLSDPRTLRAVSASSNRIKGGADPDTWLPVQSDVCSYVSDWVAIKWRWDLSMDEREVASILQVLDNCPGLTALVPVRVN